MNDNVIAAREQLLTDLRAVVSDSEELLAATVGAAGERASAARTRVQESVRAAKVKIEQLDDEMLDRINDAAKATDSYVREHPWGSIGVAAVAGLLVGVLISRR